MIKIRNLIAASLLLFSYNVKANSLSACAALFLEQQNGVQLIVNGTELRDIEITEFLNDASSASAVPFREIKLDDKPIVDIRFSRGDHTLLYAGNNTKLAMQNSVKQMMKLWKNGTLNSSDALEFTSRYTLTSLKNVKDDASAQKVFERDFLRANQIADKDSDFYTRPHDREYTFNGSKFSLNKNGSLKSMDLGTLKPGLYTLRLIAGPKKNQRIRRFVISVK